MLFEVSDEWIAKNYPGLHDLSRRANSGVAKELESADPEDLKKYLRRKYRDMAFDRAARNAIAEGRALEPDIALAAAIGYSKNIRELIGRKILRDQTANQSLDDIIRTLVRKEIAAQSKPVEVAVTADKDGIKGFAADAKDDWRNRRRPSGWVAESDANKAPQHTLGLNGVVIRTCDHTTIWSRKDIEVETSGDGVRLALKQHQTASLGDFEVVLPDSVAKHLADLLATAARVPLGLRKK